MTTALSTASRKGAYIFSGGRRLARGHTPGVTALRHARVRTREMRRSSDAAFLDDSAIVEVTPEALIGVTLEGIIRTWNPAAERLFGYTASEAIGTSITRLADVSQNDEQKNLLRRAKAGDVVGPIETIRRHRDGTAVQVELTIAPMRGSDGQVFSLVGILRDISVRVLTDAHRLMVVDELNHRVKNTLATVQSMVAQSLREATSLDAFGKTFASRLASLAITHNLLTHKGRQGARLSDLVESELLPHGALATQRWRTAGPDLFFGPKHALSLGMMIHELATNAAKYGALSSLGGHVDVFWQTRIVDGDCRLILVWAESGGPVVRKPTRSGFGTRLITDGLAMELDGDVALDFHPSGVRCEIDIPLEGAV
jgi:two-component system CheB/CheR fusion protein